MFSRLLSNKSFYKNSLLSWFLLFVIIIFNEIRIFELVINISKFGFSSIVIQDIAYKWLIREMGFIFLIIALFYILKKRWLKIVFALSISSIIVFILLLRFPFMLFIPLLLFSVEWKETFPFVSIFIVEFLLVWVVFLTLTILENQIDVSKSLKKLGYLNVILCIIAISLIFAVAFDFYEYKKEQSLYFKVTQGVLTTKEDALSACADIDPAGPPVDLSHECIKEVAIKFKDITLCSKAEFTRSNCWEDVAVASKDISICEQIPKPTSNDLQSILVLSWHQSFCAKGSMYPGAEESYCEKVSDKNLTGKCLLWLARQKPSISTCLKIPSIMIVDVLSYQTRDECLRYVISEVGIMEDCRLMSSDNERKWCVRMFK